MLKTWPRFDWNTMSPYPRVLIVVNVDAGQPVVLLAFAGHQHMEDHRKKKNDEDKQNAEPQERERLDLGMIAIAP